MRDLIDVDGVYEAAVRMLTETAEQRQGAVDEAARLASIAAAQRGR